MADHPTVLDATLTATESPSSDAPKALERPTAFGRYIMLERLGSGGMGVVYSAYDPELDRKLAVKVMRREVIADQSRLLREARTMARLQHPNVAAVHDVGTVAGQFFVAMELVDGTTLAGWLEEKPRAWPEVLELFLQAGRGLAAAHAVGVVHRDFKPSNVLVGRDGRARVVDFGLARTVDDNAPAAEPSEPAASPSLASSADPTLTRTGTLVGTPRYMSPEQFLRHTVDARSDQFSFCVALYAALWNERPFAGDNLIAIAGEVVSGRRRTPPKDSPVPLPIRHAVLRGLATKPEDRWPSLDELLAALAYAPARPRRWVPLVALLGVLTAAALAFGIMRNRIGGDPCAGAGRALSGVWDDARIANVKRAFLASGAPNAATIFEDTRRIIDVYARSWLDMQAQSCRATLELHEQSKELYELRGQCLSRRLAELGAYTELLSSADDKLVQRNPDASYALSPIADCADTTTLRTSNRGAPHSELEAGIARTRALEIAGRYDEAKALIGELLQKVRQIHHRPLEAELLMVLATVQSHLTDPDAALQAAFDSAVAAEAAHDDFAATRAWSYQIFLDSRAERYVEAHRAARIAEAILERTGHPIRAESIYFNDLGDLLDDESKFAEAVVAFRRSLELDAKLGNADKRGVAMTYNNMGTSLIHQGLDDAGREAEERAVQLFEEALGSNHPNVAMSLSNLGEAYLELGRWADASAAFERALVIDRKAFGLESEDACADLSWLARVRVEEARFAEAAALAEQVLAIRGKLGHREESVDAFDELGMAQLGLGRVRDAVANLQRAVSLPEHSPRRRARMRFHLARALWALGKHDEARALATEARAAAAKVIATHGNRRELDEMDAWLAGR